ncbi:uncharacterized protein LODBEIA_P40850 [Lodderomyces beijingensis]|uniref:Telomere length regulation protein conserved domain-containing protein n=1 Tax=Lodderomyces beijingensis TaxID=1775926 RepID=A0ABP0ZRY4_9ASCO
MSQLKRDSRYGQLVSLLTKQTFSEPLVSRLLTVVLDTQMPLSEKDKLDLISSCSRPRGRLTCRLILQITASFGPSQLTPAKGSRGRRRRTLQERRVSERIQVALAAWVRQELVQHVEEFKEFHHVLVPCLSRCLNFVYLRDDITLALDSIKKFSSKIRAKVIRNRHREIVPPQDPNFGQNKECSSLPSSKEIKNFDRHTNIHPPGKVGSRLIPDDTREPGEDPPLKRRKLSVSNEAFWRDLLCDSLASDSFLSNSTKCISLVGRVVEHPDEHVALDDAISKSLANLDGDEKRRKVVESKVLKMISSYSAGEINFPSIAYADIMGSRDKEERPEIMATTTCGFEWLQLGRLADGEVEEILAKKASALKSLYFEDPHAGEKACSEFIQSSIRPILAMESDNQRKSCILEKLIELCQFCGDSKLDLSSVLILLLQRFNAESQDSCRVRIPLSRSLVYSGVLSGDLNHLDFICHVLAFNKKVGCEGQVARAIQNSYIMDCLNMLWRNKFLHLDRKLNSKQQAFYLRSAISGTVDGGTSSDPVPLGERGALLINPATTFLSVANFRSMEDVDDNLGARHEGPVTEESIMKADSWLPYTPAEINLRTLQMLDESFPGVGDLLFSSLKSLVGQRLEKAAGNGGSGGGGGTD